jgi:hypothetical protein
MASRTLTRIGAALALLGAAAVVGQAQFALLRLLAQ